MKFDADLRPEIAQLNVWMRYTGHIAPRFRFRTSNPIPDDEELSGQYAMLFCQEFVLRKSGRISEPLSEDFLTYLCGKERHDLIERRVRLQPNAHFTFDLIALALDKYGVAPESAFPIWRVRQVRLGPDQRTLVPVDPPAPSSETLASARNRPRLAGRFLFPVGRKFNPPLTGRLDDAFGVRRLPEAIVEIKNYLKKGIPVAARLFWPSYFREFGRVNSNQGDSVTIQREQTNIIAEPSSNFNLGSRIAKTGIVLIGYSEESKIWIFAHAGEPIGSDYDGFGYMTDEFLKQRMAFAFVYE